MRTYDLSHVDAAIIDTQPNTLRLLRDVLSRLGIKKIELYESIAAANVLLTGGSPDLVLVDCDGPHEADAFRFIKQFRNEPETPNPYATIIVTTWQATPAQLMRTTNSGADDLMAKPVSPKQVQERLHSVIEARKKFVVTADYTGPDRRKSPRGGAQIPMLDVPNTLRLKALNRWATTDVKAAFDAAKAQVDEQKRLRGAIQVAFLVEYATTGLLAKPIFRDAPEHLARVPAIVEDIQRRLSGLGGSAGSAETFCRAMRGITERLVKTAETGHVDPKEVTQAERLANDLMTAMDPNRPLDDMRREVSNAVAGYRTRLAQMAQAKREEAKRAEVEAEGATPTVGGETKSPEA